MPDPTPIDLLGQAHRRLHQDATLRHRAELTASVMRQLRTTDPRVFRPGLEDDRIIAAVALLTEEMELPGGSRRDRLAELLAHHAFSHVDNGYPVCLCGHVCEGDDDDGAHAEHQADVVEKARL